MITTVIIGFAHMHVNEVALYIEGQPETTLIGIADLPAKTPENTEKRYTRAWNLKNVAELSKAPVFERQIKSPVQIGRGIPQLVKKSCEDFLTSFIRRVF